MSAPRRPAAIGFRAKTGRAIAVALAGDAGAPELIWRRELSLLHPEYSYDEGPYHAFMELPWAETQQAIAPLVQTIERHVAAVAKGLCDELWSGGFEVRGFGIVGAPDRRLERIGNFHIRAHAAEGVLFRHVLEVAADACGVPHRTIAERSLAEATAELRPSHDTAASVLKALGKLAGPPWRADERAAAVGAWVALG